MARKSGLISVVNGVRSYFGLNGITATVYCGWRPETTQINQGTGLANRVVFMPGGLDGRDSALAGVLRPGGVPNTDTTKNKPRPLWDWKRTALVSVWAVDLSNPADEEKSIEAVETLFEQTLQAVQAYAAGLHQWGAVTWTDPQQQQFGKEIRCPLTLRTVFFDTDLQVVTPGFDLTQTLEGTSG